MFKIVTPVCTKSFEWIQWVLYTCLLCVMMNWKETQPSNCEAWSVVYFWTIENNTGAKFCCCLCTAYREEKVMNLRNIQQWQSMFQEGKTNIHNDEHEWQPNTMLDETMQCVCAFLKGNGRHYYWHVMRDDSRCSKKEEQTYTMTSTKGNETRCKMKPCNAYVLFSKTMVVTITDM